MDIIVYTVEEKIQTAFLTANESNITPKIEQAIRLTNASSGRDATSVIVNSERGKHGRFSAPFEHVSEKNYTLHVYNTTDGSKNYSRQSR